MSQRLIASLLLIAVVAVSQCFAACSTPHELKKAVDGILANNQAALVRTTPGIYIQQRNLTSNAWVDLYTLRHEEYHTPASNNKVLTTAAIISALGPDHVIKTPFSGTGSTPNEPFLCVRGMGDPSMSYRSLQKAVSELKRLHVASIGQVILDDSLYEPSFPDGWTWGDLVYYYGAQPSSFILDENVVTFKVGPGAEVGSPLRILSYLNPVDASLNIVNVGPSTTSAPGTSSTVDVTWRVGKKEIYLFGQMALGASPVTLQASVVQPTERFGHFLHSALLEAGIALSSLPAVGSCANIGPSTKPLFTLESDSLGNMVNHTLQVSDNLMAEIWSRYMGYINNAPGGSATSKGVAAVSNQLAHGLGVDPKSFRQRDGSGLDEANLVSPWSLVNIVKAMGNTPYAAQYKSYLPNSNPGGALYSRYVGTPAVGRVFAKTGYISLVSSLSGWVDSDKLFSIMLDQSPTDSATRKKLIDTIVLAVANLCPLH
jgi:D-alanyl-D-alanine carboxypeptidase/D-alanyl-D-alanine-endopeptidase (penicillin-binding protein 4)